MPKPKTGPVAEVRARLFRNLDGTLTWIVEFDHFGHVAYGGKFTDTDETATALGALMRQAANDRSEET
jgi:hypothetical protein